MSNAYAGPASVTSAETPTMRSVVFSSAINTIIEWYDFLIYGIAAALVLKNSSSPTSILSSARWPPSAAMRSGFSRGRWAARSSAISATGWDASRC
ncbi:MAG: hypothetical protein MO853_10320 [Candidatus Protistobacter heckmanni]|nr:hypothetical protein [Candidatus Protistobacter heckmanni]